MNKHKWINSKCSLCKISRFISNGIDTEEPHKNFGRPEEPGKNNKTFYMLNDGNNSIVERLPDCEGDVPEKPTGNFEYKTFPDGSGILRLK